MACRPMRILVNCGCCPDAATVSICELIIGLQAQPELPLGAQVPYILPDGTCGRAPVVGGSFDLCTAVSARPLGAQGVAGVTEFFGADCQRHVLPQATPAFNLCSALGSLMGGGQGVPGVDSYIGPDCQVHLLPSLLPAFDLCATVAARPLGAQGVAGVTEFFGADCERHVLPSAPTPFNLCTALSGLSAGSQGVANVDSYVGADCLTHVLPAVPPAFNLCTALGALSNGSQGVPDVDRYIGPDCLAHLLPAVPPAFNLCVAIAALPNGASGVPGVSKYVGDDCQLHILPPSGAAVGGQNALNSTVAPGFIELGGDLLHSTTVTLHDFPLVWNGGTGTSTSSMTQATAAWDVSSIFSVADEDTKFSLSPQLVTARYRSVTNGLLSGLNASSIICDLFHSDAAHTSELSLTAVNSFSRFTDAVGEAGVTLATTRGRIQYQPVADPFAVAFAEVRNYIVELNTINDPAQIPGGVYTGLVKLTAYPNTRDESVGFVPTNFLYTDGSGNVRSAPSSAMPPPSETPITPVDTSTIDLSVSGVANHTLQGVVRISADAGNVLTAVPDGLYVPTPGAFNLCTSIAGLPVGATDGSNYVGADCQVHPLPAVPGETPLTANDSTSIDFTTSGVSNHTITAVVKISATAGNQATINADGIYVPASGGGTPGGSTTEVQYNNAGVFGGITGVTSSGADLIATAGNLKATSPQFTTGINESFGNPILLFSPNNLAVNQLTIANAIAAGTPSLTATGADASINVRVDVKGTASLLSNALTFDLTTVSNGTSVRLAGAIHPAGSAAGGFLFPFVGGNQSSGPGIWWTSNAYGSTSGLWLNFGLNWQGANSSHSPFKIRKGTGTSADGDIVFNLYPDNGTIELFPFGVAAGNTSSLVFYELAANGSNTVSLRAPDTLTGSFVVVLPAGGNVNDLLGITASAGGVHTTGWVAPASGVLTIGTIDSQAKSVNGAVISGSALVFQTADATAPGLVSIAAQTFAGVKTFSSAPTAPQSTTGEAWGLGAVAGIQSAALGQGANAGPGSVSIGLNATTAGASSAVAIGPPGTVAASNEFVSGASSTNAIRDIYFGSGKNSTTSPQSYVIHGSGSSAFSNIAGGSVTIAGGKNRGTAVGGSVIIQTSPALGSPGSTEGTLVTRVVIDSTGSAAFTSPSAAGLVVGPNGATNPVLTVDNSIASQAVGLKITGNASGAGVTLAALGGGASETLTLSPKGTSGNLNIVDGNSNTWSFAASSRSLSYFFGAEANARIGINQTTSIGFFSGPGGATAIDTGFARPTASTWRITNAAAGAGSLIVGTSAGAIGTGGAGVIAGTLSTPPSTSPADTYQLYEADWNGAGTGTMFLRNEEGTIYKFGSTLVSPGVSAAGDLVSTVAGKGLQIQSGTDQRAGNLTLIGGTLTVSNTTVTANTIVMLTRKTSGGTIGTSITYTVSAAASFTVSSDNILDTSTFSYLLIEVN